MEFGEERGWRNWTPAPHVLYCALSSLLLSRFSIHSRPEQFTSDFTSAPDLELPPPNDCRRRKEPSTQSLTPRGSPSREAAALPIVPQNTGEWFSFPSFRQSLLGGKALNRFSSFVTSGAEEWVLKGTSAPAVVSHEKEQSERTA